MIEHPETTHRAKPELAIAILLTVHLAMAAAVALLVPGPSQVNLIFPAVAFGSVFSQMSLLAVYVALGPTRLAVRIPAVGFLAVTSCMAFACYVVRTDGPVSIGLLTGSAMLMQWLAIQTPLWVVRLKRGWRLSTADRTTTESIRAETQFTIAQLLVWTTCVAALLGIGKYAFGGQSLGQDNKNWYVICGLLLVFNVLLALPTIRAAFAPTHVMRWLAVSICLAAVVSLVESLAFHFAAGDFDVSATFYWMMNAVHYASLLGSLLVARLLGFRLQSPAPIRI